MIECDFLNEYTREEYEFLRKKYPEDGTESTRWQAFPKLPEAGKTVITFNNEDNYQIDFDEIVFREDYDGVEKTYWRAHYYFDKVNFDTHYWMYAPDDPPGNFGYDVGD